MSNLLGRTLTSMEVAEMVNRPHADVLKDIRKISGHLTEGKSSLSDYFISSTYKDASGRILPCFDVTKKGCELYGTRMNGAKGTTFAVEYIERFNEMEETIKQPSYMINDNVKRAERWIEEQKEKQAAIELLEPKANYYDEIMQSKQLYPIKLFARDYGFTSHQLNLKLHELGIQYKEGKHWFLYAKHIDKGYTGTKTYHKEGVEGSSMHLYWTQKGRVLIYETLKQAGIIPLLERTPVSGNNKLNEGSY